MSTEIHWMPGAKEYPLTTTDPIYRNAKGSSIKIGGMVMTEKGLVYKVTEPLAPTVFEQLNECSKELEQ